MALVISVSAGPAGSGRVQAVVGTTGGRRSPKVAAKIISVLSGVEPLIRSGRVDSALKQRRAEVGDRKAFEEAYARPGADPWRAADPRSGYQSRKYRAILDVLPPGRTFQRALDLGCGSGVFSSLLTAHARDVVGVDIADGAVASARLRHADVPSLSFMQGDAMELSRTESGRYDLVTLLDVTYYLSLGGDDSGIKDLVDRVRRLLAPGGLCLLSNYQFYGVDKASLITRRVHDAFTWSPHFALRETRRETYFVSALLEAVDGSSIR